MADTVAWLQGCRRAETGVVAAWRTETETAAGAERPRDRDWLECRLALSRWDSSD